MSRRSVTVFLLGVFFCAAMGVAGIQVSKNLCSDTFLNAHVFTKSVSDIAPGYVLVAPFVGNSFYTAAGEVDLLDMNARIVHSWKTQYQTLYAILQPNGHLFVAMIPPIDQSAYPSGGTTGLIEELDWNGKVLWQYADEEMTHDFEVLPNGDVAYTRWERAPKSFAQNVVGGVQTATSSVWTDGIVVVNPAKQIVWQWHVYDHVNPRDFPLGPFTPRSDWSHVNSIRYTANNPISHTPAYLVSYRHLSTIFLIDAATGKIIWQSPKSLLSMQHDATLLDNGDVLVFDNGMFRPNNSALLSRVVEIDPRTNETVWTYDGGQTGGEKTQFASSIMGGAQRLPNGNTFITVSTEGKLMEVTPTDQVVFDAVFGIPSQDGRSPVVFKARKYDPAGTLWADYVHPSLFSGLCITD